LERAVELLQQARALHPGEPLIVYNVARAYEGLGRLSEARDAYATYLREAPNAAEVGAVEVRIRSIDEAIAERERLAREERRARDDAAAARRNSLRGPAFEPWVVFSVGLGALAAGGVLAGVA